MRIVMHRGVSYLVCGVGLVSLAYQHLHPDTPLAEPPEAEVAYCDKWLGEHAAVRKTVNKQYGSYRLKHFVEEQQGIYICNGAVIEAIARRGWPVIPDGPLYLNACFRLTFCLDLATHLRRVAARRAKDRPCEGGAFEDALMEQASIAEQRSVVMDVEDGIFPGTQAHYDVAMGTMREAYETGDVALALQAFILLDTGRKAEVEALEAWAAKERTDFLLTPTYYPN